MKKELQQLINYFDTPIVILNSNLDVVMQNEISRKTFGEVIGKKCYDAFHGLNSPPDFCRAFAALKGDTNWEEFYEEKIKKWLMAKAHVIESENDKLFLHFIVDITELKNREMEFKKINEILTLAVSILRHDLLNSFTIVRFYLDMIEDLCNHCREMAIKAIRELENALIVLKYISDLPKLSLLRELSLREVIEKVGSKYEIEISIDGDCKVLADDGVFLIFDNLIRNSIEHGKADEIRVTIYPEGDFCNVIFADNGVGIPEEIKNRVFEEGFTTSQKHSGLGLFIVKLLLERYWGGISLLDSQKGATFLLKFKRA
ncbi:MAG: HAMP domain-containing sensor histidine kinase [Archaeoglobaceae archaeon]|nr:PAS domain-containing sensor histidine kinase [Archaeoglobaceae archaeon]MDW7990225.1 HAMP domain-containing sensor histidine kinase [Archaeoglobaceae archaeon]